MERLWLGWDQACRTAVVDGGCSAPPTCSCRVRLSVLEESGGLSGSSGFLRSPYFSFESDNWHVRASGLPWDTGSL